MGCYDLDADKNGNKKQMITVKCRDEKLGLEVHLKARADTKFSTIMYHYRTKFNIDEVTFMYHGKKLEGHHSPFSLGMEDNTVIYVKNDFTKEELSKMVWDSKKWRWLPPKREGEPPSYPKAHPESLREALHDYSSIESCSPEADLPISG